MKSKITTLVLVALLLAAFLGCTVPEEEAVTSWTVSGTYTLNGANSDTLMLGAFFYPSGDDNAEGDSDTKTLVSDLVTVTDGAAFTMAIDVSDVTVTDGDIVCLYVVQDENGDGAYDDGDERVTLEPVDDDTDPVFTDCSFAWFKYYDESSMFNDEGWTVYEGLDDESIDTATLAGAAVTNWTSFWD